MTHFNHRQVSQRKRPGDDLMGWGGTANTLLMFVLWKILSNFLFRSQGQVGENIYQVLTFLFFSPVFLWIKLKLSWRLTGALILDPSLPCHVVIIQIVLLWLAVPYLSNDILPEILKTFLLSYRLQNIKFDHWQTMVTLQFGRRARFGVLDTTAITSISKYHTSQISWRWRGGEGSGEEDIENK